MVQKGYVSNVEPIYGSPGSIPAGVEVNKSPAFVGGTSGVVGFIPETLLSSINAALDALSFAQQNPSGAGQALNQALQQQYSYNPNSNLPFGEQIKERLNLPESVLPGIQDVISGGEAEKLRQQGYQDELASAALGGMIATPFGVAGALPAQTLNATNKIYDLLSLTPGATKYLEGATGIGSMLGRGVAVGTAGSAPIAFSNAYDAKTNEFSLPTFGTGLATGAVLAGGITGTAMAAQAAKTGSTFASKQLRQVVEGAKQALAGSDNHKLAREMLARREAAVRMQQQALKAKANAQQVIKETVQAKMGDIVPQKSTALVPVSKSTALVPVPKSAGFVTESGLKSPESQVTTKLITPKNSEATITVDNEGNPNLRIEDKKTGKPNATTRIFQGTTGDLETSRVLGSNPIEKIANAIATIFNPIRNKLLDLHRPLGRQFNTFANKTVSATANGIKDVFKGRTMNQLKAIYKDTPAHIVFDDSDAGREYLKSVNPELHELLSMDYREGMNNEYKNYSKINSQIEFNEIAPGKYAVVRDIKDREGLLNALEKESDGFSDELIKLKIENSGIPENLLIDSLMRKRRINVTPELAKFYHSPLDSAVRRITFLRRQQATGELLGDLGAGSTNKIIENKMQEFKHLPESTQNEIEYTLQKFFREAPNQEDWSIKAIQGLNRLARIPVLGSLTSGLKQLSSGARYAFRFNAGNTLEGLYHLMGGKIPENLKTKMLAAEALYDIPKSDDPKIFDWYENYMLMGFTPFAKAENKWGLATSYRWVVNESKQFLKTGKVDPSFKLFLDVYYTPEEQMGLIKKATQDKRGGYIDEDIMHLALTAATEKGGLVLSHADKALLADPKHGFSSFLYNLLSYQIKDSKIARDSVVNAVKTGDYGTALFGLYTVLGIGAANAYIQNKILEFRRGETTAGTSLVLQREYNDSYKNELINKAIPFYNNVLVEQIFDNKLKDLVFNQIVKGGDVLVKKIGAESRLVAEGNFSGLHNPEDNPTYKYGTPLVPRAITETNYYLNPKHADIRSRDQAKAYEYARKDAEIFKTEKEVNAAKAAQQAQLDSLKLYRKIDPRLAVSKAQTLAGERARERIKEDISNRKNYAAKTPIEGAVGKGRKDTFDAAKTTITRDIIAATKRKNNPLTQQEAQAMLDNINNLALLTLIEEGGKGRVK